MKKILLILSFLTSLSAFANYNREKQSTVILLRSFIHQLQVLQNKELEFYQQSKVDKTDICLHYGKIIGLQEALKITTKSLIKLNLNHTNLKDAARKNVAIENGLTAGLGPIKYLCESTFIDSIPSDQHQVSQQNLDSSRRLLIQFLIQINK